MAEDATAVAGPLLIGLPDEIVIWEILVRLDPKSLLRCRAVRRAWCGVTSTRRFLLANHSRQPALPILFSTEYIAGVFHHDMLAFDHRSAQVHTVARLDKPFGLEASCDGLLVLSKYGKAGDRFSVCNPATRQYAPLRQLQGFRLLGMYPHRPTGEYRLLLNRSYMDSPKGRPGCYIFALGSDHPPRYIGWPKTASWCIGVSALVHDCLHWYSLWYPSESKPIIVFDTIAESFRQMRAPIVPTDSSLFDMDGTVGIHSNNTTIDTEVIDIWVLKNYEREVWDFKYRIELPFTEIRGMFAHCDEPWEVDVVSVNGDVLLLVHLGWHLLYVNTDGKLFESSYYGHGSLSVFKCRLKQSLVQHTFFPSLEGYAVNASLASDNC
ncbi:hypothetical protein VPH35_055394 [Triticum aestivum]